MSPPRTESCPKTRAVGARLARALHRYLEGELDDATLVRGLRRLASDIEGDRLLQVQAAPPDDRSVAALFGWWQQRMSLPRAKLTAGRRRALQARLAEGYTEEQIRRAIAACSASEWHQGKNKSARAYNDIVLICRSGEKLESFIAMADEGGGAPEIDPDLARLEREAMQAMKEGRIDDYNRADERLRAVKNDRRRKAHPGEPAPARAQDSAGERGSRSSAVSRAS